MTVNRPYTFELAHQLLTASNAGHDTTGHYDNAARNGVAAAQLDRAAATLQRLAPPDFDSWIRMEYIVDGWLHGYLDQRSSPTDPSLSTWVLGQLADQHYKTHP